MFKLEFNHVDEEQEIQRYKKRWKVWDAFTYNVNAIVETEGFTRDTFKDIKGRTYKDIMAQGVIDMDGFSIKVHNYDDGEDVEPTRLNHFQYQEMNRIAQERQERKAAKIA